MKYMYLVRHCKASGQEAEAKLTSIGRAQAELLANFFIDKNIAYIVSSPFERAVASIRPLSLRLDKEIHIDDRLSERILAREPLTNWMDKLKETYSDLNLSFTGGESSLVAMQRGIEAIHHVLQNTNGNSVVVTHGNILSLILKHYNNAFGFDDWIRITNPDVFELQFTFQNIVKIERVWGK